MYNFNGSKRKRQLIALISLVVIAAMVVTTLVSALIYGYGYFIQRLFMLKYKITLKLF